MLYAFGMNNDPDKHCYSIGVAARLVRVSTHTLRKWEDRYNAVKPVRTSGGTRKYSAEEVARLTLLKELTDLGHSIGSIATLPTTTLKDMTAERMTPTLTGQHYLQIAVIGEALPIQLKRQAARLHSMNIVAIADDAKSLGAVSADVLVVESNSLTENTLKDIDMLRQTTGIDRIAVLYAFAPLAIAENLSDARTAAMRLPVNYRELERTLLALVNANIPVLSSRSGSTHRFSRQALARIASTSPTLVCECPRHVAEIIILLSDFEAYSAQCVNDSPADAQLHRRLQNTAAVSYSLFEESLVEIAALENIAIEDE